jgi:hypothetical protein
MCKEGVALLLSWFKFQRYIWVVIWEAECRVPEDLVQACGSRSARGGSFLINVSHPGNEDGCRKGAVVALVTRLLSDFNNNFHLSGHFKQKPY